MCFIILISSLSICCYCTSAARGGGSTQNKRTGSTAGTNDGNNLEDITLQDVFMMLREKFPEVPFYSEEDSHSENTSSQNDTQKEPNSKKLVDIPDEAPTSIWESCCNIC